MLEALLDETIIDALFSMVDPVNCGVETVRKAWPTSLVSEAFEARSLRSLFCDLLLTLWPLTFLIKCTSLSLLKVFLKVDAYPIKEVWRPKAKTSFPGHLLTLVQSYLSNGSALVSQALLLMLDIIPTLLSEKPTSSHFFDIFLDQALQDLMNQADDTSIIDGALRVCYDALYCDNAPERTTELIETCTTILESLDSNTRYNALWLLSRLSEDFKLNPVLFRCLPRLSAVLLELSGEDEISEEPLLRMIFLFAKVCIHTNTLLDELDLLLEALAPILVHGSERHRRSICWYFRHLYDEVDHDTFFKLKFIDSILYEIYTEDSNLQCSDAWEVIRCIANRDLPRVALRPYFMVCFNRFLFDSLTFMHLPDVMELGDSFGRLIHSNEVDFTNNPLKDLFYASKGSELEAMRPFKRPGNRLTMLERIANQIESVGLTTL